MNANGIVVTSFFEPIKESDIVPAESAIISRIVVYVDDFDIIAAIRSKIRTDFRKLPFQKFNTFFCFINTFYPYIHIRCRTHIINPKFHSFTIYFL